MQPNGALRLCGAAGRVRHPDVDLKLDGIAGAEQALEHPQRAAAVAMSELLRASRRRGNGHGLGANVEFGEMLSSRMAPRNEDVVVRIARAAGRAVDAIADGWVSDAEVAGLADAHLHGRGHRRGFGSGRRRRCRRR
jgi:hypothetical protein